MTNSEESVVQEKSPEPEALHLPVQCFVELRNDGDIGLCEAVRCARWRVPNTFIVPSALMTGDEKPLGVA